MAIKRYISYYSVILSHKLAVFNECRKEGIMLRGITHDISKMLPDEAIPFARRFFSPDGTFNPGRDENGNYPTSGTGDADFEYAYLLHRKRNKHHWEAWILPDYKGGIRALPMDDKSIKEMVCDWRASSGVNSNMSLNEWYLKNSETMILHQETRKKLEKYLGIL